MKITELVLHLLAIREIHGDLECYDDSLGCKYDEDCLFVNLDESSEENGFVEKGIYF